MSGEMVLAERAYFLLCQGLGRLLRSGKYSMARIVDEGGNPEVRKQRFFYAPLLVWMGDPLVSMLDTGVRVLPAHDWQQREREIYRGLFKSSVRTAADGSIVLPCFPGTTLSTLLEDPELDAPVRKRAIELAVIALVEFHRAGFTHGDAMAENVMVDFKGGVARWFDFETMHDANRPEVWRRADDVRALLATCSLRTARGELEETLNLILDVYADEEVARIVAASFTSALRRPLIFHLGQAALSFEYFQEIGRLLEKRLAR